MHVQGFWAFEKHITEQKKTERAVMAVEPSAMKQLPDSILEASPSVEDCRKTILVYFEYRSQNHEPYRSVIGRPHLRPCRHGLACKLSFPIRQSTYCGVSKNADTLELGRNQVSQLNFCNNNSGDLNSGDEE